MQTEPAGEWLRLAEEYRAKSSEELRELAADYADLTEPAQQALRQEMHSRKLGDPQATSAPNLDERAPTQAANQSPQRPRSVPSVAEPDIFPTASVFGGLGHSPKIVPDESDDDGGEENASGPHDYTWKTVLCDCETNEEAQYLAEALRISGLESWVQGPREFGRRYARVLVAADQLEQARAIAERPIPKEIVDESKEEAPEFVEPKCPKCGSDDVVLEAVDTANRWRCEHCDAEWSDAAEVADANPGSNSGSAGKRPA
jgi:ribosomal protein L37AE/L43A